MIRAYDDNGNVVDLAEWERQIRADAFEAVRKIIKEAQKSAEGNMMFMPCFDAIDCCEYALRWVELAEEQKND